MAKICHAHCPDSSGGLLAVLGLAVAVVLAVIVGRVVESLFVAIIATASVLGVAGIALFAYLIRRDRWTATGPRELAAPRVVVRVIPARGAQAVSAPRRSAAALPAGSGAPQSFVTARAPLAAAALAAELVTGAETNHDYGQPEGVAGVVAFRHERRR